MAKIRGFKPDLWTDEDFVEVSAFARLLWLGLWNYACDNGHLPDRSKQIKMRVLPTDDVNCAELLRELAQQGLIKRADGWITIPNLGRHQKIDRRFFTTCDMPGCQRPDADPKRETRRDTTSARVDRARAQGDGDGDGIDGDGRPTGDAGASAPTISDEAAPTASDRRGASSQLILGEWLRDQPARPPSDVVGHLAKKITTLVRDGIDAPVIRQGLDQWAIKGLHPSTLPSVVYEIQTRGAQKAPTKVHVTEQPPDGLSPEQYREWYAGAVERARAAS